MTTLTQPDIAFPWKGSTLARHMIERAAEIAREAHRHAYRKHANEPYFEHVQRVAHTVIRSEVGTNPDAVAAAYLHDTLEDTSVTVTQILEATNERVVELVQMVTKPLGMPYDMYVRKVARHPVARVIKRADLADNIGTLPFGVSLWSRYADAIKVLSEIPE